MYSMAQEIITYVIVAFAVLFVVSKTIKRLKGKKKRVKADGLKFPPTNNHVDCSDCAAECMLRDATKITIDNDKDLCEKIEV